VDAPDADQAPGGSRRRPSVAGDAQGAARQHLGAAKPPREPSRRDWGMLAVDPVRGWAGLPGRRPLLLAGQQRERLRRRRQPLCEQAGDHNAYIPPNEWEATHSATAAGRAPARAQHPTRRSTAGLQLHRHGRPVSGRDHALDPDYVRFYDIDRGGVHRELPLAARPALANPSGSRGIGTVDPNGRVLYLHRQPSGYYARDIVRTVFTAYDIYRHGFTAIDVPKPFRCTAGWARAARSATCLTAISTSS